MQSANYHFADVTHTRTQRRVPDRSVTYEGCSESSDTRRVTLSSGMIGTNAMNVLKAPYGTFTIIPNSIQRYVFLLGYNAFYQAPVMPLG